MPSDEVWGDDALGAVLSSLPSLPPPSRRQTPLAQEVDALAARADDPDAAFEDLADPGGGWFARIAVVMVDAVLARDKQALDALDAQLRRVHRRIAAAEHDLTPDTSPGRDTVTATLRTRTCVQLSLEFVRAALERVAPVAAAVRIAGTQHENFLRVLTDRPGLNSRQIAQVLGAQRAESGGRPARSRPLDASQVSKIGKRLLEDGLVFAQRSGSGLSWELTPRGRLAIDRLLPAREDSDHAVTCVVIAVGGSQADNVVDLLSDSAPERLQVVRAASRVTYARQDSPEEDGVAAATPVTVGAAVADLLDETQPQPPQSFSLANGVRYEEVALAPA
jgi:hypothetical protein